MTIARSFKVTGKCNRHRWMRWAKRGPRGLGAVPVGLRAPMSDDFCDHCRQPRSVVEGVPA